jgi:large subunit ribosomal protein L21
VRRSGTLFGLHRHRAGAFGCRRVRRPQPVQHPAIAPVCAGTELGQYERYEESVVYAVVKAGGSQHKVAVGDTFTINRLAGAAGDKVALPAILLVDGDTVTSDAAALAKVTVTGEILEHGKGPKIHIHKFKNKTGYHKRQGHRQPLTSVVVRDISKG